MWVEFWVKGLLNLSISISWACKEGCWFIYIDEVRIIDVCYSYIIYFNSNDVVFKVYNIVFLVGIVCKVSGFRKWLWIIRVFGSVWDDLLGLKVEWLGNSILYL